MPRWCKHEVWMYDGRGFNRLKLCLECKEPIFENIFHVLAYIRKPRKIVNGKVELENMSLDEKIKRLTQLDILRILDNLQKKRKGRPRKRDFSDKTYLSQECFTENKELDLKNLDEEMNYKILTTSMNVRKLHKFFDKTAEIYNYYFSISAKMGLDYDRKFKSKKGFSAWSESNKVFTFFARCLWKLKKSDIKAIFAYFLVKNGAKKTKVCKFFHVKPSKVSEWGPRCEKILKYLKYVKTDSWRFQRDYPLVKSMEFWKKLWEECEGDLKKIHDRLKKIRS